MTFSGMESELKERLMTCTEYEDRTIQPFQSACVLRVPVHPLRELASYITDDGEVSLEISSMRIRNKDIRDRKDSQISLNITLNIN
jgi:hypothetical protein